METTAAATTLPPSKRFVDTWACTLYYFYSGTIFGGFLVALGLIGNFLSVLVMAPERKKSSTVQALCLLAMADSLLLVVYAGTIPAMGFRKFVFGWMSGYNEDIISSVYLFELARIFNQVSAFITMILTWQRYVAVCIPHKSKQLCTPQMVNRLALASYAISIAFYFPNFFLYTLKKNDRGLFFPVSTSLVKSSAFQTIYSIILSYLMSYIIPVGSLVYMSIKILSNLDPKSSVAKSDRAQNVRKDLTKSSIAIVVLFVLCQSFSPIRRILMWIYDPYLKHALCGGDLVYFSGVPHLALMLNSAANFLIYIVFAKGFRKKMAALFTRNKAVAPLDPSSSVADISLFNEKGSNIEAPLFALFLHVVQLQTFAPFGDSKDVNLKRPHENAF
ncbi:hypothetical protein CAPTEDRAFT_208274 [Capitella teleta]|uniref:G-protein coupled receptors family 1 profile domain-containing protein n=1 Tax=Capitella teleta TaxID=283909 RepID=R7TWN2_CAPTE|nr:hypothetical protein CAPTEDRAFT_208274 [Capitella teleta]|eukprot:ELT98169.1 hypothetical protein CAPTEDRAFT_208274 [Capitella teleta]